MSNMESISCKELRDHMADVINQVAFKSKKYTLTRHGSAVAVLFLDEWTAMEKLIERREDEEDLKDAGVALKKHSGKRGISLKAMKKKLGI